jgi:hypothetical protein
VTDQPLFRLYEPEECGSDGYPIAWHRATCDLCYGLGMVDGVWKDGSQGPKELPCPTCKGKGERGIKDIVRAMADYRCARCMHPYRAGDERISAKGEWSPCDESCRHAGPLRYGPLGLEFDAAPKPTAGLLSTFSLSKPVEARWRILTVHHLNGRKADLRWWNLCPLDRRCHLAIQGKVNMEQAWPLEHSSWFKVYAAGHYAAKYEGREITREEAEHDLDRLLALERLA